jgi:amino acid transporter
MSKSESVHINEDEKLKGLGYEQKLKRSLSTFQNFALSFSVISILTGTVQLYGHGLTWGGPKVMLLGWPLVSFFTFFIALSLAELASAFPTAGALYHWASILGGRFPGWLTAWLNIVGQFAITAAIDFGLAEFLAPLLGFSGRGPILAIFSLLLTSHALLNHFGMSLVSKLNMISAWYHVLGVVVLIFVILIMSPLKPLTFLLEPAIPKENPVFLPGFLVALLQAAWTFTGYDASAHAAEETLDASSSAPRGILLAVGVSALFGYAMLICITLAIGDLNAVSAAPNPFIALLESSLGKSGTALVWMAVFAMWFCGLASVTSNSRMLFAFARDGGLPKAVSNVSERFKTPHVAIWISVIVAFLLSIFAKAFTVVAALSTVALYAKLWNPDCLWLVCPKQMLATKWLIYFRTICECD